MFKVNNKDNRTLPMASFWCLYFQLWTYFTPCSGVSTVTFEQVNASWAKEYEKTMHKIKFVADNKIFTWFKVSQVFHLAFYYSN